MTTLDADQTAPLSPDERYELAARASAAERRNRPTMLVVLGLIVVMLASVFLAWSLFKRSSSTERLDRTRNELRTIMTEIATIEQLRAEGAASDDAGAFAPIPNLLSDIEGLSGRAGIARILAPRESTDSVRGAARHKYAYNGVKDESLENLLEWVRLVRDEVPGMRVFSIKINPDRRDNAWNMDVTFSRFEQAG